MKTQDMEDAIFARQSDGDPSFSSGEEAARQGTEEHYAPWAGPEFGDKVQYEKRRKAAIEEAIRSYTNGKKVLNAWTMRQTARLTVAQMCDGSLPGGEEGEHAIRVECGYVGTAQAYATYVFNPRR